MSTAEITLAVFCIIMLSILAYQVYLNILNHLKARRSIGRFFEVKIQILGSAFYNLNNDSTTIYIVKVNSIDKYTKLANVWDYKTAENRTINLHWILKSKEITEEEALLASIT